MTSRDFPQPPDTSSRFFERLYQGSEDPWNFRGSPYERERYRAIIDSVSDRHYHRGFEPGCAIGELTAQLALLCDRVDAIDFSASAVNRARSRCSGLSGAHVRQGALPDDIPDGVFDLIVFSEIGYYFSLTELTSMSERLWRLIPAGGRFVACHWLGHSDDHVLHGATVASTLERVFGPDDIRDTATEGYVLQRWSKH